MKYYVGLVLSLLMALPLTPSQAAMVNNNMENSKVTQNYYFECWTDQCQVSFEGIVEEVEVDDPVEEVQSEISENESEVEPVKDNEQEETPPISSQDVIINEVVSAPGSGQNEWVELYNAQDVAIALDSWWIEEGAGRKTELFGQIEAGGYLVFETSNLNNSGDIIQLKDSDGNIIDEVVYGDWDDGNLEDNCPASDSETSLITWQDNCVLTEAVTSSQMNIFEITEISEDDSSGQEEDVLVEEVEVVLDDSEEDELVVDEEIITYQYSDQVRINEFMPDPEGDDSEEWIELYNSGQEELDLSGWTLDDADGGSDPYDLSGNVISAESHLIIRREESNIALNNDGDEVVLRNPDGEVVSQVAYSGSNPSESYIWANEEWGTTDIPTEGQENQLRVITESVEEENNLNEDDGSDVAVEDEIFYQPYSLSDIKFADMQERVVIQGVVSVLPGVFGKNYLYLTDNLSGLQIYYGSADWPELNEGDELLVSGRVSESSGERKINVKGSEDIVVLGQGNNIEPMGVDAVNEDLVGGFLRIQGELVEKQGSKLMMTNENGDFIIYLKRGSEISSSPYSVGQNLQVTGVLVQNNDELRFQPRQESDIEVVIEELMTGAGSTEVAKSTASGVKTNVTIGLVVAAIVLLFSQVALFVSKKQVRRQIMQRFGRLREQFSSTRG